VTYPEFDAAPGRFRVLLAHGDVRATVLCVAALTGVPGVVGALVPALAQDREREPALHVA
jgi:hypothetical protein